MTLLNLILINFACGFQRAYSSANTSPTSLLRLYADSGRRAEDSVIGSRSGGVVKGIPINVSEEAKTRFVIPILRQASRMLYVLDAVRKEGVNCRLEEYPGRKGKGWRTEDVPHRVYAELTTAR